jgi:phosphoglycerate kinase
MKCQFLSQKEKSFFRGKKIFVRLGINVPLENNKVKDDFRLKAILPTIEFLLDAKARIILAGHIGRESDLTLNPVFL